MGRKGGGLKRRREREREMGRKEERKRKREETYPGRERTEEGEELRGGRGEDGERVRARIESKNCDQSESIIQSKVGTEIGP